MASYSPVFSSQFILSDLELGYPPFLVPAGFTAVIRDYSIYSSVDIAIARLFVQNSEAAPGICVAMLTLEGAPVYAQWQGRVAVPEGGIISLATEFLFSGPAVYVGGYLLRNTLS